MKRGDFITVAMQGDYGKPRPALVVQSDIFSGHTSICILPLTSDLCDAPLFRIPILPGTDNGLSKKSQVMVDKIMTIPVAKAGHVIGSADYVTMQEVDRTMALFLGIAK